MECRGKYMETMRVKALLPLYLVAFLFLLNGCEEQQSHTAPAVNDRDSASMMVSYGVNTLISDSGIIKYRIVTERWEVNTVKVPPRWIFEKGIFLEQFDRNFHIEGYIQADTAWYYDQQKLWELRGRVSIRNVNGLVFKSEELWWDGLKHEFYSHQFSRVVTPERTLEGTYFRSDEQMAHYEVSNSVGSFQSTDMEPDSGQPASDNGQQAAGPADTMRQEPAPTRPAAVRHAATQRSNYKP